jgi:hypothetical protein
MEKSVGMRNAWLRVRFLRFAVDGCSWCGHNLGVKPHLCSDLEPCSEDRLMWLLVVDASRESFHQSKSTCTCIFTS